MARLRVRQQFLLRRTELAGRRGGATDLGGESLGGASAADQYTRHRALLEALVAARRSGDPVDVLKMWETHIQFGMGAEPLFPPLGRALEAMSSDGERR